MDYKIAMKWAAALESGNYMQGTGQLRTPNNKFCCLGVLCNLHALVHPAFAAKCKDPQCYGEQLCFLPPTVKKWSGMASDAGAFSFDNSLARHTLIWCNDKQDMSFKEIAAIIRAHWKEL